MIRAGFQGLGGRGKARGIVTLLRLSLSACVILAISLVQAVRCDGAGIAAAQATPSPTSQPSPTASPSPTVRPSPTPDITPSPSPSPSPSPTKDGGGGSPTPTPTPSDTPTPSPTPSPSDTPTPSPTPSPTLPPPPTVRIIDPLPDTVFDDLCIIPVDAITHFLNYKGLIETTDFDFVYVLDRSGSMTWNDKYDFTKGAALALFKSIPSDQEPNAGIIPFQGRPTLWLALTQDRQAVIQALENLPERTDGTDIAAAVGMR